MKIDKNIPVPTDFGNRGRPAKYPELNLLKVGESFFVPNVKGSALSSAAQYRKIKDGKHFVARSAIERGVPGARIWRYK